VTPELAWIIGLGLLLVYEAYSLANRVPGDTLSEAMWRAIYRRPLLPFLIGLVIGHFVWQADKCAELLR
jgi:hypothetical protein